MKLILLAAIVVVTGASFVEFLNQLQTHHSFQRLPEEEKVLFSNLVLAAENDELTDFIDRVGLVDVLKLMDHMSQYDAERFAAYLAEHSNYTHHTPGHEDIVNKRDNDEDEDHHGHLHNFFSHHRDYYQHMPSDDVQTYMGLMDAARHHSLTAYVNQVGYGAIFGLMEQLDEGHRLELNQLIENAMTSEASSTAVKRQDSHGSHGWHGWEDFSNYLQGLNSRYYEHLPNQEQQTYHELVEAANNKNITGYIAEVGYGPIFGFIEHLDFYHANQVYDYLEKALTEEAAAAAASSTQ